MSMCPSCGLPVSPHEGAGRPPVYCGEPCRRQAEFTLRRLYRRLESYELELREAEAGYAPGRGYFDDEKERKYRICTLRRWIRADKAKLKTLLRPPAGH